MASSHLRGHVITTLTVLVSGAVTAGSAALAVGSCAERDRLHHARNARSLESAETELTSAELPQQQTQQTTGHALPPAAVPVPADNDQQSVPEGRDLASVLEEANAQMARMPPVAGHAAHANNDANHRQETQEGLAAEIAKAILQIEDERQARRQEEHAAEAPPPPSPEQAPPAAAQPQPASAGELASEDEQRANPALTPAPPSFSSGAGPFVTEAPIWSASSMGPSDPSMGAGRFDTERTLPAGVVYLGVSGIETQAALSALAAAQTPNVATTSPSITSTPNVAATSPGITSTPNVATTSPGITSTPNVATPGATTALPGITPPPGAVTPPSVFQAPQMFVTPSAITPPPGVLSPPLANPYIAGPMFTGRR